MPGAGIGVSAASAAASAALSFEGGELIRWGERVVGGDVDLDGRPGRTPSGTEVGACRRMAPAAPSRSGHMLPTTPTPIDNPKRTVLGGSSRTAARARP